MKCPKCKSEIKTFSQAHTYNSLTVYFYDCPICKRPFVAEKGLTGKRLVEKFDEIQDKMPPRIKDLSPDAYKYYSNSLVLNLNRFGSFAGDGLRMALEWLLWDYLVKFRKAPEAEIKSAKLHDLIQMMTKSQESLFLYAEICSDIVRIYGNDVVHVQKKLPDLSFDQALFAFEKLCGFIDAELQIHELKSLTPKFRHTKA